MQNSMRYICKTYADERIIVKGECESLLDLREHLNEIQRKVGLEEIYADSTIVEFYNTTPRYGTLLVGTDRIDY